jgi:hypothetical protein
LFAPAAEGAPSHQPDWSNHSDNGFANVVQDEDGEAFALIWSRSRKANAD